MVQYFLKENIVQINEKEIKKHPQFADTNARGGANKTI